MMIENYVIIIGAMKAGTTSLFELLALHPKIAPSTPKEPGFFAFDDIHQKGFEWYESLFDFDPGRHVYGLEATTDYTKYPYCKGVAERMTASGRNFKLMYIMRHPLRRIESHARHVQGAKKELGQTLSPRPDHGLDFGVSEISLDASRYAQQIDQYKAFKENGDLLLLSFEEMTAKPEAVGRKVFDFLGLDETAMAGKLQRHNAGKRQIRTGEPHKLWRAAQAVSPLRALAKTLVPDAVRRDWREKTRKTLNIDGRFTLTPEEENDLLKALAPDLARLKGEYGFDVEEHWDLSI